jgi:hypothetical protein
MARLPTLFAVSAACALVLGILSPRFDVRAGMSVTWHGAGYMIPNKTLCFGAAVFFCLFAFLYSIRLIPWSVGAGSWHFGLSILCIIIFSVAFVAAGCYPEAESSSNPVLIVMLLFVASPVCFLLIQGLYLIDAVRRCWPLLVRS